MPQETTVDYVLFVRPTFKHWSFVVVLVAPSAKPEAEPISINIAAAFTIFLRTLHSMDAFESNILAFRQQQLSRNNTNSLQASSINNRSTCLQKRLSS